jgi:hypothetical protein
MMIIVHVRNDARLGSRILGACHLEKVPLLYSSKGCMKSVFRKTQTSNENDQID